MLVAKADHGLFSSLANISRIAVAVSGGSDSMALLRLVVDWARAQSPSPEIFTLTVDHGLRLESAAEARRVAAWCRAIDLYHEILVWEGAKPKTGIQAKARDARYGLMTDWCLAHNVPVLLTAHTLDDQAETVVMRQRRTKSVLSLAGIWPERDWNGIRILRPLLHMSKTSLQTSLTRFNQDWIEDPSNHNLRFERVRIRSEFDQGSEQFAKIALESRAEVNSAALAAAAWIRDNVRLGNLGLVDVKSSFTVLPPLAADLALLQILNVCGFGAYPERESRVALLEWLEDGPLGRRTLGGAVFVKRKAALLVAREAGRIDAVSAVIPASGEINWDKRFLIMGPVGAEVSALAQWGDLPDKSMPQFLRLGLPAVSVAGNLVFVPQLRPNDAFNYSFIREFHKV